jgi:hypothetical protein
MKIKITVFFLTAAVFLSGTHKLAAADMQSEIFHLLSYVEKSDCTFIRNGKRYESKKARQHLERKYNYAKLKLKATEDFIKYIASKSSRSGETYMVECDGNSISSAAWLTQELSNFRKMTK